MPNRLGSFETTDETLAQLFAKRIGNQMEANKYFVRSDQEDKNKVLSPDTAYSFPVQLGSSNNTKKPNSNRLKHFKKK